MKKFLRKIIKKVVTVGAMEVIENQRVILKEVEENKAIIAEITENYTNLRSTIWDLILEHTHLSGKFFPYKRIHC